MSFAEFSCPFEGWEPLQLIQRHDFSCFVGAPKIGKKKKIEIAEDKPIKRAQEKDSLFEFNPNEINLKELLKLGFTNKQANVFNNYRNKGGKFYKKEDKKAYFDKFYKEIKYLKLTTAILQGFLFRYRNEDLLDNIKELKDTAEKNKYDAPTDLYS